MNNNHIVFCLLRVITLSSVFFERKSKRIEKNWHIKLRWIFKVIGRTSIFLKQLLNIYCVGLVFRCSNRNRYWFDIPNILVISHISWLFLCSLLRIKLFFFFFSMLCFLFSFIYKFFRKWEPKKTSWWYWLILIERRSPPTFFKMHTTCFTTLFSILFFVHMLKSKIG